MGHPPSRHSSSRHRSTTAAAVAVTALALCAVAPSPQARRASAAAPPGAGGGLADDAAPPTVGRLGTAKALRFTGNATFPADTLRAALARDLEFELAAAPGARADAFADVVRRRVVAGYRHAGFPKADAEAAVDRAAGTVTVAVVEGRRYLAGPVRVTGAKTIPAAALAERLTKERPRSVFRGTVVPADGTIAVDLDPAFWDQKASTAWEVGKPVSFDPSANRRLADDVRTALAELGYFRATFWLDTPADPRPAGDAAGRGAAEATAAGEAAAPLEIEVRAEGPRATVGDVTVTGLKANTRDALLALAGLTPGQPLDLAALRSAQQRLWDSARFKRHAVRGTCDPATGVVALTIDVEEVAGAPPLGAPLTDVQQAALRARDWLLGLAGGEDDVVLEAHGSTSSGAVAGDTTVVAGFARGFAIRVDLDLPAFAGAGNPPPATAPATPSPAAAATGPATAPASGSGSPGVRDLDVAVVLTGDQAAAFAPAAGIWASSAAGDRVTQFNLAYAGSAGDPPGAGNPPGVAKWQFNAGASLLAGRREPGRPAVEINLGLAPAGFLDLAVDPSYRAAVRGGELVLHTSRATIRIDAATGRLIEAAGRDPADGTTVRLSVERGALARVAREWRGLVPADRPPAPDGALGALARATAVRLLARRDVGPAAYAKAAAAFDRLLGPDVLAPVAALAEGAFAPVDPDRKATFAIPVDARSLRPPTGAAPYGDFPAMVLPYTNDLFARASWPWTLSRQSILQLAGRGDDTLPELVRLHRSSGIGPVGCLAVAEWANTRWPPVRQSFAKLGLSRLTDEAFAGDVAALTGGDWPAAEAYRRLAARLRDLPAADVEALAAALRPAVADGLRAVAADLRAQPPDAPPAQAAAAALGRLWAGTLRDPVAARLRALAE
jgi:hypothetical protein